MPTKINKPQSYKYLTSNRNIFDVCLEKINTENLGSSVIIPHVCNNVDMFGAGFASAISDKFPIVKMNYHMLGKKILRDNFGYCQIIVVYENLKTKNTLYVANMISQNGIVSSNNPRPINYFALTKSMNLVSNFIKNKTQNTIGHIEKIDIHCPKFGSGLAGGNWYFISDLIEDMWKDFSVTVHSISGRQY